MSVDKFGMMGDAEHSISSTSIIQPIHHYAMNLDDLENVQGFNEKGKKDGLYSFKLTEKGMYIRHEINLTGMDNGGIEDQPVTFVYSKEKWIPLSLKFKWEVDIKLSADKIITKGDSNIVLKIFNSGKILGSLVSDNENLSVLKRDNLDYFIAAGLLLGILSFKAEFKEEIEFVKNPPDGSTIVIEGRFIIGNNKFYEIIPGLEIKCETPNTDFKIIIKREGVNDKIIVIPSTIETQRVEGKKMSFDKISIWNNFYIKRIRLTDLPVTMESILYL